MNWCFIGQSWNIAQKLGHFLVNTVRFPYFPTDFEIRKECRIIEREKEVSFDMTISKTVIRVVDPCFALFLDPGVRSFLNELGSSG